MMHKIIVADDSQTIQKVIKITFAQHEVELVPCLSEEDLMKNMGDDISLILLDFSLSETKSGYDLAKILNENFPVVPILGMLGTFDSVDEEKFRASGYADKVVKPFETEKFIAKCEALLNHEIEDEGYEEEEGPLEADEFREWSVESNAEKPFEATEVEEEAVPSELTNSYMVNKDELTSELDSWGLQNNESTSANEESYGEDLTEESDVTNYYDEYPPVIESSEQITSKFLSAENLISDEDLDDDETAVDEDLEVEECTTDEDQEYQPDEENEADFWAIDADAVEEEVETQDGQVVEVLADDNDQDEDEEDSIEQQATLETISSSISSDMEKELRSDLAPIVEKYVKKYCDQNLEKIVWEIVPDLAENLIRKELKNISQSVIESVNN
jgi:DNA-binding response OmpR family regulator